VHSSKAAAPWQGTQGLDVSDDVWRQSVTSALLSQQLRHGSVHTHARQEGLLGVGCLRPDMQVPGEPLPCNQGGGGYRDVQTLAARLPPSPLPSSHLLAASSSTGNSRCPVAASNITHAAPHTSYAWVLCSCSSAWFRVRKGGQETVAISKCTLPHYTKECLCIHDGERHTAVQAAGSVCARGVRGATHLGRCICRCLICWWCISRSHPAVHVICRCLVHGGERLLHFSCHSKCSCTTLQATHEP
jgi:hypothetical protein